MLIENLPKHILSGRLFRHFAKFNLLPFLSQPTCSVTIVKTFFFFFFFLCNWGFNTSSDIGQERGRLYLLTQKSFFQFLQLRLKPFCKLLCKSLHKSDTFCYSNLPPDTPSSLSCSAAEEKSQKLQFKTCSRLASMYLLQYPALQVLTTICSP